ncbi:MAG: diaminopimelate decarboxylase family protein [Dethiobacteria bacterium]|nr:diaminopimelate decarboxylase [Bacillota bacterium]MDW7729568.1 diaminopimelate decarboxylase [Bacillota bacterium]
MIEKRVPLSGEQLEEIAKIYPTPFHLYDEKAIRENARAFYKIFSWIKGFKNHFAVKACPNPAILTILLDEKMGVDCSSLPELLLSDKVGFRGEEIVLTSNDTPPEEFAAAARLGAVINLDDLAHIETLERSAGIPETISFRYNPGEARTGNVLIGLPQEAKYGITRDQVVEAYRVMKDKGVKHFGLHTMVASNELESSYFVETARMLFELAAKIKRESGVCIELINMGGGIGIPYRPDDQAVDLKYISEEMEKLYNEIIVPENLHPLRIVFECGRLITGPYGYLVSRVRHVASKYKMYVGLDSCMANLMRPGLYGAYHHITVPGKEELPHDQVYDVTGSLCENNDKFAIDRKLPLIEAGDLVVIHDTGAHGYSMGFNYNGKLRSAELLLREDGSVQLIRRAETIDDYFATMRFPGSPVKV